MTELERACEYLEAMAKKAGGDVKVFTNASGKYIMQRKGDPTKSVQVSLEEPREEFDRKVQRLMGD